MKIDTGFYKVVDDTGKMKFVFEAKYDRKGFEGKDIIYARSLLKLKGLTLYRSSAEELGSCALANKRPNSIDSQVLLPGVPSGTKKIKGISHYDATRGKE